MKAKRKASPEWAEAQFLKYHSNLHAKIVSLQHGAKLRNLEWNLSEDYIKSLGNRCYWNGVELTFVPKKPNTWSLDRLDNSKGYIEGNVVPCCARINLARGAMDADEFRLMCKSISRYQNSKQKQVSGRAPLII